MDFQNFLSFQILTSNNILWILFDKVLNTFSIGSGQIYILIELWKSEGLNQTELAARLNVTTPTVNKMIKSLENEDLVLSKRNKSDRRITNIYLTEKSNELKESVFQAWAEFDKNIFKDFSETEKLILFELNTKLKAVLLK